MASICMCMCMWRLAAGHMHVHGSRVANQISNLKRGTKVGLFMFDTRTCTADIALAHVQCSSGSYLVEWKVADDWMACLQHVLRSAGVSATPRVADIFAAAAHVLHPSYTTAGGGGYAGPAD